MTPNRKIICLSFTFLNKLTLSSSCAHSRNLTGTRRNAETVWACKGEVRKTRVESDKGYEGQYEGLLQMYHQKADDLGNIWPHCWMVQVRRCRKGQETQCILPQILVVKPTFRTTRPLRAVRRFRARKTYLCMKTELRSLSKLHRHNVIWCDAPTNSGIAVQCRSMVRICLLSLTV